MAMDINEIRRKNVRFIICKKLHGNAAESAAAIKKQPSEIYRRLGQSKESRNFGPSFRKAIEKAAGYPRDGLTSPTKQKNPLK